MGSSATTSTRLVSLGAWMELGEVKVTCWYPPFAEVFPGHPVCTVLTPLHLLCPQAPVAAGFPEAERASLYLAAFS